MSRLWSYLWVILLSVSTESINNKDNLAFNKKYPFRNRFYGQVNDLFNNREFKFEKSLVYAMNKPVQFQNDSLEIFMEIDIGMIFQKAPTGVMLNMSALVEKCVHFKGASQSNIEACILNSRTNDIHLKLYAIEGELSRLSVYSWFEKIVDLAKKVRVSNFSQPNNTEDYKNAENDSFQINSTLAMNAWHLHAEDAVNSSKIEVKRATSYAVSSVIQVEMEEYFQTLERYRKDREIFENMNKTATKHYFSISFSNAIFDALILCDHYHRLIQRIISGVSFANYGQIHPDILSIQSIKRAAKLWEENNKNSTKRLIIPSEEFFFDNLKNMTKLEYSYKDGKLIFSLNIPLIEKQEFMLYEIIPYPLPQYIGKNFMKVNVYIQPQKEYLLVLPQSNVHQLVSPQDLKACSIYNEKYICPPEKFALNNGTDEFSCEFKLFHRSNKFSNDTFKNCDIRISHYHYPYVKNIDNKGTWIYSLPNEKSIKIHCVHGYGYFDVIKELHTTGVLSLTDACIAQAIDLNITLTGSKNVSIVEEGITSYLSISNIIPEIRNVVLTEEILKISGALTSKEPSNTLRYHYTLQDLIKFMDEQKREMELHEEMKLHWEHLEATWSALTLISVGSAVLLMMFFLPKITAMTTEGRFVFIDEEIDGELPTRTARPMQRLDGNLESITIETNIAVEPQSSNQAETQLAPISNDDAAEDSAEYISMESMTMALSMVNMKNPSPPPPLPLLKKDTSEYVSMKRQTDQQPPSAPPNTPIQTDHQLNGLRRCLAVTDFSTLTGDDSPYTECNNIAHLIDKKLNNKDFEDTSDEPVYAVPKPMVLFAWKKKGVTLENPIVKIGSTSSTSANDQ